MKIEIDNFKNSGTINIPAKTDYFQKKYPKSNLPFEYFYF